MIHKYALAIVAGGLLIFAVASALYEQRPERQTSPPVPPPHSPYGTTVAGAGMVEPNGEASGTAAGAAGSQCSGVVTNVHVAIGQRVKAGDLLFELDDRQTVADLKVRQAAVVSAQEQLRKLQLQPRPEEVPPSEAQVATAESN